MIWGVPDLTTRVGNVIEDQPASLAGMMKDDLVVAIDGQPVQCWGEIVTAIQDSCGDSIQLILLRAGHKVMVSIDPWVVTINDIFGEEHNFFRIGILASGEIFIQHVNLLQAIGIALERSYLTSVLIFKSVIKLFQGKISLDNLGGPIQISQAAGQAACYGIVELLSFIAILSVNLAILNLLPIPALDGGHIVFYLWEVVTRRPVSLKLREKFQQIGVALLIILMGVIVYNDITRLMIGVQ